jgi:hypothetical protein
VTGRSGEPSNPPHIEIFQTAITPREKIRPSKRQLPARPCHAVA